mmetsp:Transcript_12264/g.20766  ORF Transcript_12264/g.20766 Transcript_12264/m.20766 type:complete len:96 (-) Transcript_12264:349-636(-)
MRQPWLVDLTASGTVEIDSVSIPAVRSVLKGQRDSVLLMAVADDAPTQDATKERETNTFVLLMVGESGAQLQVAQNRQLAVLIYVQATEEGDVVR